MDSQVNLELFKQRIRDEGQGEENILRSDDNLSAALKIEPGLCIVKVMYQVKNKRNKMKDHSKKMFSVWLE